MAVIEHRGASAEGLLAGAWWTVVGAAFGVGVAGILTIGWMLLLPAIAMTAAGTAVRRLRNSSAWMLVVGVSAAPWYLAWLNRDGPGIACHSHGTETSCIDEWSPWPFVGLGVVLVVAGMTLTLGAERRKRRSAQAAKAAADHDGPDDVE